MKRSIVAIGTAVVLMGAGLGTAVAVNCKGVNKSLEMGRTLQDIVENSAGTISEDDVKKCQEEAAAAKAAGGAADAMQAPAGGGEKK